MNKKVLGLDLGSNSLGWALMNEKDGEVNQIIDLGSRIFNKAVGEKVPTPKNQERRDMRLGRRVLQRRARRKQRMINYLISLDLLPSELANNFGQEKLLNELGNPYELRTKGLDKQLEPHQFGRVLLHFVARRGFLSSKKQIAGDLVDDPDTIEFLQELEVEEKQKQQAREAKLLAQGKTIKPTKDDQSEGAFKADISGVYQAIKDNNCRTLGEYLFKLKEGEVKRNRSHDGGHLRTDRKMYQDELALIWQQQTQYFAHLPDEFMQKDKGILAVIFYQRPLKLRKDRIGKCSLETKHYRANTARLEVQRFRYLQDINNLQYFEREVEEWISLNDEQKEKLKIYFEFHPKITITALKKELGLDKFHKINLETKNLKGNITACEIRFVIGKIWDEYSDEQQSQLFEDLFTIKKKSSLKARLITHWDFDKQTAVKLCLIELEPSHSNHSLKAIKCLLPHLEKGLTYDKARVECGYGYEVEKIEAQDKLPQPLETSNPIVNKGMHELRRVVNAIIKQHGKPDIVRIEMARDLEMNTQRYKDATAQQNKNKKANEEAEAEFLKYHPHRSYATKEQKLIYRLWQEQQQCCVYSGKLIAPTELWSDTVEIDHIVPRSLCLDDSYINKVACLTAENRVKGQKTPVEAWGNDEDKWNQITQRIERFYPDRPWKKYRKNATHPKKKQFYMRQADIADKYGMSAAQLNDTRYISKLAQEYLQQLGCKVSVTKGVIVAEVRSQWGLNSVIGQINKKERTDHRHHAIDAVVIAHMNIGFHNRMTQAIKHSEETGEHFSLQPPYDEFRTEVKEKLKHLIVSHTPQRKLSGALHKATGAGYIKKHGGLVYRKAVPAVFQDSDQRFEEGKVKTGKFKGKEKYEKNAEKIVDKQVKNNVLEHIKKYENLKTAFDEENLKQLKLGKNPIKRVRVLQSAIKTTKNKTAEDILNKTKFGVRDKAGKTFKYMSYGNTHHVEIIQNIKTGKVKGEFVTMMEASHRVKGINMPKQPIIKTNHGEDWKFLMALHINDTVSIENEDGERIFYRVQKIGGGYDITLRLHTASTIKDKNQELGLMAQGIIDKNLVKHQVNAIGGLIDD
ncbi:CRISPR-associated protein, Csn1 family [uncultured Candidatus Thioglobus sp.]|nr:CRISPR-associated protein, Csn1 family [uncultured Candidatus Thioglobus sp.]